METEIRFYYSIDSKDKVLKHLKKFKELNKKVENIVRFDKDMPSVKKTF